MPFSRIVIDGKTLTRENFTIPPMKMGILPFWFWNGELKEDELEWQMREYKDKGVEGIILHGRFGLKIPYLSKEWFEKVKFVVQKSKKIELDIWIYDEMNWPSGTAERQVLKKYPHLSQKYLEMVVLNVTGPLFTFLEATDDRYINTGNSKPIAAYACSAEEFEKGIENLIDLTPNLSFEAVIPWEAPPGDWRMLYFLEKEADYYIDALNPESTKRFLEITHEQYKNAVGNDFTTIVPGFYTDEPAMHYYHVGMNNYIIPWSKYMFKIFRNRRGYDLKPLLPALFTQMGDKTAQIRHDFWSALTEQYSESYYQQIREWCDDNKVIFTGHLLGEEWMRMHARCEGNIFKHLKHMHLTGVDHLYPVIGTEKAPDQHVAIKLASSAAHHHGSARLLCESMGGTYWDCSLERMKWIANWEYVLGVTIFNNHGYHYSIEGERKRDWPPSQFYHHTWWKYYRHFTEYMARLGHLLSGGRHVAKILILYPIDTFWTNYRPQENDKICEVIEQDFNYLTDVLLRMHFDFDYTDEDILADGIIKDDKITIREEAYELLILPPLTHLKSKTFIKLQEFVQNGGKIISSTLIPYELLGDNQLNNSHEIEKLFGIEPKKLLMEFQNGSNFNVLSNSPSNNIHVITGKGLFKERRQEELRTLIETCITPDITVDNENVFYLHRVKDEFDIYFFVNTQQEDQGEVGITFEKIGLPELWNANTGKIEPIEIFEIINGRLKVKLNFPQTESHILIIRDEPVKGHITESNLQIESTTDQRIDGYLKRESEDVFVKLKCGEKDHILSEKKRSVLNPLKLGEDFFFHIEDDNVHCISKWKMKIVDDSDDINLIISPDYEDKEWLDVTLGAWEMQLPMERDLEDYPVSLWYRTSFKMEFIPTDLSLLVDGLSGSDYQIYINGNHVREKGSRSKIDAEIKSIPANKYITTGENYIVIKLIVEKRTDGILDLLRFSGDFSLAKKNNEYVICKPMKTMKTGDWTKQGYPYFSGTGVYETTIDIPEEYSGGKLILKTECGEDVLSVIVNNKREFVLPWHPYDLDITEMVYPGKNQIVLKVTNTLMNMIEAVEKESGILEEPIIKHYHKYSLSLNKI
jgi:hypothetical protein